MNHSSQTSKYRVLFTLFLGCVALSACEIDEEIVMTSPSSSCESEQLSEPNSLCEESGMMLATQAECDAGLVCQMLSATSECGEEVTALCHMPSDPECLEDGYVPPDAICEAEGLVLATDEECEDNDVCRTITSNGPCDMIFETFCKEPEDQCLALPACSPGTVPSTPCFRGEESCETVTMCEETISCRPELACNAAPDCDEGEVASRFACEEGEDDCSAITMCADTIFCRPDALCRATPSCGEGEVESMEPCLATESPMACRAVSMCGTTIVCR